MKPTLSLALAVFVFLIFGVSCRRAEVAKPVEMTNAVAVAVVAGTVISTEAFKAELKKRYRDAGEGGLTAEQKLAALETLVRNEALYAQAKAAGFDQSLQIQTRIKQLIVAQFKEQQLQLTNPTVSEGEIEAVYQASAERYAQSGAVRGAIIYFSTSKGMTEEKRTELAGRAEAVLSEARAAADENAFAQIVARHSEDQASRYRGGDLGWVSRDGAGTDPAVREALFALNQPGEFAPVVQGARGFYVAKLLEKREAGRRSLAEVKEGIRYQLSRQKAEQAERDFYEAMKAGLDIQVNHTVLDAVALPGTSVARTQQPPAMPAQ